MRNIVNKKERNLTINVSRQYYAIGLFALCIFALVGMGVALALVPARATTLGETLPVTILSPNGGETWPVGSTQTVRWSGGNLSWTMAVDIRPTPTSQGVYSSGNITNSGSYTITVPSTIPSGDYYAYVVCQSCAVGTTGAGDWSDARFSIVTEPNQVQILNPQMNNTTVPINTTSGTYYSYTIQNGGGISLSNIVEQRWIKQGTTAYRAAGGEFISSCGGGYGVLPVGNCNRWGYFIASDIDSTSGFGKFTNGPATAIIQIKQAEKVLAEYSFSVVLANATTQPSITVLSPNGGEVWAKGSSQEIKWSSSNYSGLINISLNYTTRATGYSIIRNLPNTGSYNWVVGFNEYGYEAATGANYLIYVSNSQGVLGLYDESDAPFSIVAAGSDAKPDLVITSLSYVSSEDRIAIRYCNNGGEPDRNPYGVAETFYFKTIINSVEVAGDNGTAFVYQTPAAGECKTTTDGNELFRFGNAVVTGATVKVTAIADIRNTVAETNEFNNTYSQEVTLGVSSRPINTPPKITSVTAPANLNVGEYSQFGFAAVDPDRDDLTWSVNWGETGINSAVACSISPLPGESKGRGYTTKHAWNSAGTYQVSIYVTDCHGGSDRENFTVVVGGTAGQNTPPKITTRHGNAFVIAGAKALFSWAAEDPDNDDLSWAVNWGSGESGAASCPVSPSQGTGKGRSYTPTYSWPVAGKYEVKVSVYDCRGGNDTMTFTVIVQDGGDLTLDLNADGRVDRYDANALANVVAGSSPCPEGKNCDLNADGAVNVFDLLKFPFIRVANDLTQDGRVDQYDTNLLANVIAGTSQCPGGSDVPSPCDVNRDRQINVFDLAETSSFQVTPVGRTLPSDPHLVEIENRATLLKEDRLSAILTELKLLRNLVQEQQIEIKYLKSLTNDLAERSSQAEEAIKNFITYGVDENTKKLGAGERAAVMHSYKSAFDKLPETESELTDAIKIANGRWPSEESASAEARAMAEFRKIYNRDPNLKNLNDDAAITIMAYGLRQRAENRNLKSEAKGILTFKWLYSRTPQSTEDWNIVQAITYSGAKR